MRFLAPGGLWLLATLPVILALYILKLRRRRRVVPATWLWEKTLAEMRADKPFERLRASLPLLLQLLAAALLALAAARPVRSGAERLGDTLILVLDASASMQAEGKGGSRFEAARRRLSSQLASARKGDRAALILAGREPVVAAPLSTDLNAVYDALHRARATDGPADLAAAVRLGSALVAGNRAPHVVVATDDPEDLGAWAKKEAAADGNGGPPAGNARGKGVRILRVGSPAENAGIVSFQHRLADTRSEAFIGIRNFGSKPRLLRLELELEGKLVDSRTLELDAGQRRGVIMELPPSAAGILRARIDAEDALKVDDQAYLQLREDELLRVLLVTRGNLFLETAWALEPHVLLEKTTPEQFPQMRTDGYDLVAFDRWAPGNLPPGNYILFGAGSPSLGIRAGAPEEVAKNVAQQNTVHPLMRHVDLGKVRIAKARPLSVEPWVRSLASSAEGYPLLAAVDREGRKAVVCAFSLLDSDWPLRVSFPIFLANATVWLAEAEASPWSGSLKPGDSVALDTPEPGAGEEITITAPGGRRTRLISSEGASFRDTTRTGVYSLKGESFERKFTVSLLSERESHLTQGGGEESAPAAGPANFIPARLWSAIDFSGGRDAWRGLLILVLLFLSMEWGVYLYRKSL